MLLIREIATGTSMSDRQAFRHQERLPSLPLSALSLPMKKRNIRLPDRELAIIPELPLEIILTQTLTIATSPVSSGRTNYPPISQCSYVRPLSSTIPPLLAREDMGEETLTSHAKQGARRKFRGISALLSAQMAPTTSQDTQQVKAREARVSKINKTNQHSRNEEGKTSKVLILGSYVTGESTILRSMKLFSEGSYNRTERESFRDIIFTNMIQSMRAILEAMEVFQIHLANGENHSHVATILMQPANKAIDDLPPDVGPAIKALWDDSGVQECFRKSKDYQLNDSAQ